MPKPTPVPKKTPGKPMGIPVWGWVIAAVLGIVIGYTILKKSGNAYGASTSNSGTPSDTAFAGESESGSPGGGNIAIPLEEILKALGLRGSSNVEATPTSSEPTQQTQENFTQESVSSGEIQTLESQSLVDPRVAHSSDDAYWESFGTGLAQTENPENAGLGPSPYVDYASINTYMGTVIPSNLMLSNQTPIAPVTPNPGPAVTLGSGHTSPQKPMLEV